MTYRPLANFLCLDLAQKECTRIVSNVIVEDARSSLRAAQDGSFRSPGIKQEVLIAAYEQLLSDIRRETLVFTC